MQQYLSDYAASFGAQCSLSVWILSGEPWFSLTTEHADLPSMQETEASWAEEQSVQPIEAKVDELTQSTMQDLWEVLVWHQLWPSK